MYKTYYYFLFVKTKNKIISTQKNLKIRSVSKRIITVTFGIFSIFCF